jgi:hypothetical protein
MKSRQNFYMDEKAQKSLEEVKKFFNTDNSSEAIRYALALTKKLAEYKKDGYEHICIENNKKEKKELIII